jgi:Ku70/Ku80-like protein
MAPRSNWKGYLKLSLVSASIAIYPATSSSEKVRFNTLNRATGNRLKRQMIDSVTGEEVPTEEQVKGYVIGDEEKEDGRHCARGDSVSRTADAIAFAEACYVARCLSSSGPRVGSCVFWRAARPLLRLRFAWDS